MGEKKHINKIPPKIPGQSRENFVYVFFSLCFFSLPIIVPSTIMAWDKLDKRSLDSFI